MHDDDDTTPDTTTETETTPSPPGHAIEASAIAAWLAARGVERDEHPLDPGAFTDPVLTRAAQRLTRLHHRGWSPARPMVETVPLFELEAPAHRGQLAALLPLVPPPVARAMAALREHHRPRAEAAQRAINRAVRRDERDDDCNDGDDR